nr:MAG TPA: hypothetical protein [Caudoviricetes sp.]
MYACFQKFFPLFLKMPLNMENKRGEKFFYNQLRFLSYYDIICI